MGLDIGARRIGVAVADTATSVAMPLRVMDAHEVLENSPTWRALLQDNEPEILVCGLPKTLAGGNGSQAARAREAGMRIAKVACLPIEFADERLSSAEAKRYLHEQGLSEREMRGKIDSVAASLVLETWLASRSERREGE